LNCAISCGEIGNRLESVISTCSSHRIVREIHVACREHTSLRRYVESGAARSNQPAPFKLVTLNEPRLHACRTDNISDRRMPELEASDAPAIELSRSIVRGGSLNATHVPTRCCLTPPRAINRPCHQVYIASRSASYFLWFHLTYSKASALSGVEPKYGKRQTRSRLTISFRSNFCKCQNFFEKFQHFGN